MQQFDVSRFTVRAALDVIIERCCPRDTFVVARPPHAGTWMVTSLDNLVRNGFASRPIVIDAIEAKFLPHAADALGRDNDARAAHPGAAQGRWRAEPYAGDPYPVSAGAPHAI
jgi:hypothetical protein